MEALVELCVDRITPACAGISQAGLCRRGVDWDHPRVRGDKIRFWFRERETMGSPPRARG